MVASSQRMPKTGGTVAHALRFLKSKPLGGSPHGWGAVSCGPYRTLNNPDFQFKMCRSVNGQEQQREGLRLKFAQVLGDKKRAAGKVPAALL